MIKATRFGTLRWKDLRFLVQDNILSNVEDARGLIDTSAIDSICPHHILPVKKPGLVRPRGVLSAVLPSPEKPRFIFIETNRIPHTYQIVEAIKESHQVTLGAHWMSPTWSLPSRPAENFSETNLLPFVITNADPSERKKIERYLETGYACGRSVIVLGSPDTILFGLTERIYQADSELPEDAPLAEWGSTILGEWLYGA